MNRKFLFITFILITLAGCADNSSVIESIALEKNEKNILNEFEKILMEKRYKDLSALIDENHINKDEAESFFKTRLSNKDIESIEFIKWHFVKPAPDKVANISKKTTLIKLYTFGDKVKGFIGVALLTYANGDIKIGGYSISDYEEQKKFFTFNFEKFGFSHFLFFLLFFLSMTLCVYSAYKAWKSKLNYRFFWVVLSFIGLIEIRLIWHSGLWQIMFVAVGTPGFVSDRFSFARMFFSLPIGAIITLIFLKRFKKSVDTSCL